jgi:3-methyladenine DNA glycosylase/8-oxoguanine DNA glycosylase
VTELLLSAASPFSLPAVVQSHGWVQLAPFVADKDGCGFRYLAHLDSDRVVELHAREAPNGVQVTVDTTLTGVERVEVADKVRWMVGLEQDLSAFYTVARSDPKLSHVEGQARGRMLRSATVFEDVVKTILTTNTTWSGTKRMVEALATFYGAPLPADETRHAFPTPQRLAEADEPALRTESKLGYRAPYVLQLAREVTAGAVNLEELKTLDLSTPELRKRLLAIKGVGPYAVASLLMLLGHYDFVPVDSWAFKLVSHEWHNGAPIGKAEVEQAFADWGEWKALAYWFRAWSYQESSGQ